MKVRVLLFAVAKERVGSGEVSLELPAEACVRDVRDELARRYPSLANLLPHVRWAVNAEYASEEIPLTDQAEIALIPPVSGG